MIIFNPRCFVLPSADPILEVKLISREKASEWIGRKYPNRIRNYELEHKMAERHRESLVPGVEDNTIWIISEWCPFNGIHCAYFEHATFEDLTITYKAHEIEVNEGRMHSWVLDKIQKQINTVLNVQEKSWDIGGKNGEF